MKTFKNLIGVIVLSLCIVATFISCNKAMKINMLPYPETRCDAVVDNYFGTEVADPYRWLEDDRSAETAEWVAAQNRVTFDYLHQIPFRDAVRERLTELYNYPKVGMPRRVGDWWLVFRNDGLQNQSVLYRCSSPEDKGEVLLDPNTLSEDGTVALSAVAYSENGRYMAYSVSVAGSDWVEIRIREVATGKDLKDVIRNVKFSGASWAADSKGFYYSAYDKPKKGAELSEQNRFQKVYYHKLGQAQRNDALIYEDKEHPLRYFSSGDSDDGRWLFVYGSEGTYGTEILYRKAADRKAPWRVLFKGFEWEYSIIHAEGDMAYVLTNQDAPNCRLLEVELESGTVVRDVIPQREDALLESVSAVGGGFVARYLKDACSKVEQWTLEGEKMRDVAIDGIVSASGFGGKMTDSTVFYSLTGFTSPSSVWELNLRSGESREIFPAEVCYDPSDFETKQVFFSSKDGTQVPMFITHRKGLKLNGNNPTYLYGYGGFSSNRTPRFVPAAIMLMEQGGVHVDVCLRGGNEYGEEWHRAGMLQNKQNVFDDFIGAAEWLIAEGYTSPKKLAIAGGSNGGLLVGACMTQRPDLYAVALPAVGVMDMLRYHLFTVGWGWVVEYGSSESEEQFPWVYAYSPLHNIRDGVNYPATLVTTADHDDRVVPAHSFKFAAHLQAAQGCERPTLIRIDTNAGHGAGKPTSKRIDEAADTYSFMLWNTDTEFRPIKK